MKFADCLYNGVLGVLGNEEKLPFWVFVTMYVLCLAASYLIGSVNFAILISKKKFGKDIREYGSKNAGATNMKRTFGNKPALATLLLDMLKCIICVFGTRMLVGFDGACLSALCCVIGHAYPIYFEFRGGKGVASAAAALLCIDPWTFLLVILIFTVIVLFTKYVSLGSVFGAMMAPLVLYNSVRTKLGHGSYGVVAIFILCMFIVFLHRTNIKRVMNGTENRLGSNQK